MFRCSETSLDGFGTNLLIGFSEIYILVRMILKENYETLGGKHHDQGAQEAASRPPSRARLDLVKTTARSWAKYGS